MNQDFVDLLRAFNAADVRFLVVGAYALALHGRPRATGDIDLWVDETPENATRVMRALGAFGAPTESISEADFASPGVTYQIGVVPGRIDILTDLTGITLAEAWGDRVRRPFGDVEVDFIGREAFIRNKRRPVASGIWATSRAFEAVAHVVLTVVSHSPHLDSIQSGHNLEPLTSR